MAPFAPLANPEEITLAGPFGPIFTINVPANRYWDENLFTAYLIRQDASNCVEQKIITSGPNQLQVSWRV